MNDIVVPTTMIKIISKKINKNVGNKRINLPLMVNYPPNISNLKIKTVKNENDFMYNAAPEL